MMTTRRSATLAIAALATFAAITFHLPPAAAAPSVFGLRYMASSYESTTVSWFKAEDASTYKVYVNGKLARTVTDPQLTTTIELPQLLGPKDVVTAEAIAGDGAVGASMTATYRYMYPPYDVFLRAMTIDFGRGSGTLDEAGTAKVQQFVGVLKQHGFGELRIVGHNAVLIGTFNALTMASARADAVSAVLAAGVTLPTTVELHGVKVSKGSLATAATRQVEIFFR